MKKLIAILLTALMLLSFSAFAEESYLGLTSFYTIDTEGTPVTQDIFADYDLTLVNVWATWCGYCINELPNFTILNEKLPENANVITICTDAHTETELALEILAASNVNFQTLILTQDMVDQLVGTVSAFPTTFFVDSEGYVVTDPIVGIPSLTNSADVYYDYMMYILGVMEANGMIG